MRAGVRSAIFPCSAASLGSAARPRCRGRDGSPWQSIATLARGRGSPRSRREGDSAAGSWLRADSFPERKPWLRPPAARSTHTTAEQQ